MSPRARRVVDGTELANLPVEGAGAALPLVSALSPTEQRREQELEDLLETVGTDGQLMIYHIIDGRAAFAGRMSLQGFSLAALMESYGGGEKSVTVYGADTKKIATLRVFLDPSIPFTSPTKQRQEASLGGAARTTGASGAALGLGDMSALIAAMAQSQLSSMQMMQTMMGMGQQQMTTLLTAVTGFLTARPEKDPMDAALRMAEVMRRTGAESAPSTELFSVFEKGMSLAARMNGGSGDGTLGVIHEGVKGLVALAEGYRESAKRLPAGLPGNAALGPDTDVTKVEGSVSGQSLVPTRDVLDDRPVTYRPWIAALEPYAGMIQSLTPRVTPEKAARVVLELVDDPQLEDFFADVEDETPPGFLDRMGAIPFFAQVSVEWARSFVEQVYVLTSAEGEGASSSEAHDSQPQHGANNGTEQSGTSSPGA